jgi:hypothetical protein
MVMVVVVVVKIVVTTTMLAMPAMIAMVAILVSIVPVGVTDGDRGTDQNAMKVLVLYAPTLNCCIQSHRQHRHHRWY